MYTRPDSASRFDRTSAGTGRPATRNRFCALDWKLDVGEGLDLLRLAVLEHLEVVGA